MPFYAPPWAQSQLKQVWLLHTKTRYQHQTEVLQVHSCELCGAPSSPAPCLSSLSTHSNTPPFEAIPTYFEGCLLATNLHWLHLLNHRCTPVYTGFSRYAHQFTLALVAAPAEPAMFNLTRCRCFGRTGRPTHQLPFATEMGLNLSLLQILRKEMQLIGSEAS